MMTESARARDTSQESTNISTIEPIIDAGRLLTDVFHEESTVRRNLVLTLVSPNMKKTTPGQFLFGPELGEKIKRVKALTQSAVEITAKKPPTKNAQQPPGPLQNQSQTSLGGQKTKYRQPS